MRVPRSPHLAFLRQPKCFLTGYNGWLEYPLVVLPSFAKSQYLPRGRLHGADLDVVYERRWMQSGEPNSFATRRRAAKAGVSARRSLFTAVCSPCEASRGADEAMALNKFSPEPCRALHRPCSTFSAPQSDSLPEGAKSSWAVVARPLPSFLSLPTRLVSASLKNALLVLFVTSQNACSLVARETRERAER
jgi:hypothetical protein